MRILVDIVHLADVNFFKLALNELNKRHDVTITVLNRGKLADVVKKEYPGFRIVTLGTHRKSKIGKMLGLIQRTWQFIRLYYSEKPDVVTSFGFYPAIAAKLFAIPSILFYDDYEYRFVFKMCQTFATRFYIPEPIRKKLVNHSNNQQPSFGNIRFFNGFKETAYLKDFKPDPACLQKRNLVGKPFVFCRDIDTISLNYQQYQHVDLGPAFKWLKENGFEVLYYPEKKHDNYNDWCTHVDSPVPDILSLQHYAAMTISSGDTIARESALLGTPVLYVGGRNMAVNLPLQEIGLIQCPQSSTDLLKSVQQTALPDQKEKARETLYKLNNDDITALIIDVLENNQKPAPKGGDKTKTYKMETITKIK